MFPLTELYNKYNNQQKIQYYTLSEGLLYYLYFTVTSAFSNNECNKRKGVSQLHLGNVGNKDIDRLKKSGYTKKNVTTLHFKETFGMH